MNTPNVVTLNLDEYNVLRDHHRKLEKVLKEEGYVIIGNPFDHHVFIKKDVDFIKETIRERDDAKSLCDHLKRDLQRLEVKYKNRFNPFFSKNED